MYRLIFILVLLLNAFFSTAQVGTTSPYSSFGLGDLHGTVISELAYHKIKPIYSNLKNKIKFYKNDKYTIKPFKHKQNINK